MNTLVSEKKEGFLRRHRFALFFFAYLVCYHVLIVNRLSPWRLNELTYSLYCVDFSFGFASKLLPGAVFRLLLGPHVSEQTANVYVVALIVVFFFGLAALLERFLLRIPIENRRTALFLLLFFVSGAYSFSIFTKWIGLLDTAWLFIALLFFVCVEHRRLRFLIPALYALSLIIHFSAVVFYLTFFSIILLYHISRSSEKRDRRALWAVFVASLAVTAAVFLLFLLNESKMLCPIEEFHEKLHANGTDFFAYFDYAFYRIWDKESFIPEYVNEMAPSFLKFLYLFYYQIQMCYQLLFANPGYNIFSIVCGTLLLLPVLLFVLGFHWRRLRQESGSLNRLCAFLMLVQFPFIYAMGILFAIGLDMTRYLSHATIGLFCCLLTVLYHENDTRAQFFERLQTLCRTLPVQVYCLAYTSIALYPCS